MAFSLLILIIRNSQRQQAEPSRREVYPEGWAPPLQKGDTRMLNWAMTFLVLALIAAVLGFTGLAGTASHIAWILFVVFLVMWLVSFFTGRSRPVT